MDSTLLRAAAQTPRPLQQHPGQTSVKSQRKHEPVCQTGKEEGHCRCASEASKDSGSGSWNRASRFGARENIYPRIESSCRARREMARGRDSRGRWAGVHGVYSAGGLDGRANRRSVMSSVPFGVAVPVRAWPTPARPAPGARKSVRCVAECRDLRDCVVAAHRTWHYLGDGLY